MAACSITLNGIIKDCKNNIGGIRKVWIAPYTAGAATVDSNKISAISNLAAFKGYEFSKNTASMTSTRNKDMTNGSSYVSTELVLQFNRMETEKRIEVEALSVGDLQIIVMDNNGIYWFLGYDAPVEASAGTAQTGTAKSDGNFYNITFTDESFENPYEILDTVLTELS